jgi:predicted nucleic acid-binding protein
LAEVVVVDSGIFIATVLPESISPQANYLIAKWEREQTHFHAPTLLKYEMVAVSRKAVHRGRLTVAEGEKAMDILLQYNVILHFDIELLRRSYALATELNRPTAYDMQYLALAIRLGSAFWTADERLFNAVKTKYAFVRWLGDITP